jgi:hypothetical protein
MHGSFFLDPYHSAFGQWTPVTTTTQITETKSLSEYQKQGSGVPTPEELTAQSVADLASARAASIAASAEQEIELPRGSIN